MVFSYEAGGADGEDGKIVLLAFLGGGGGAELCAFFVVFVVCFCYLAGDRDVICCCIPVHDVRSDGVTCWRRF